MYYKVVVETVSDRRRHEESKCSKSSQATASVRAGGEDGKDKRRLKRLYTGRVD
jgi:hypothetical protein